MRYYTLNEVKNINRKTRGISGHQIANKPGILKSNIFLSHSHKDADLVLELIEFLVSLGNQIYVDWLDYSMPTTTSAKTAIQIKEKIKSNDKFIVLLTENSKNSKWVPWELGFADGCKKLDDIAILPILRNSTNNFNEVEYMGLYPTIYEGETELKIEPAIFPPAISGQNRGMWLKEGWLDQKNSNFLYG